VYLLDIYAFQLLLNIYL